ncbi:glycoside hydrolase family 32 protein [Flavilitoribacter nigricans]|uniref:Glycosyl hydrolase family 32 n=1 Tax=Flavilitoribacter nigricans (strain ATCC 23147 / DSM 23189 / NBRC 102662 / NCIMB 1420 / SS-2) TaxID=1122177 RepID=A0A2D0NHM8_FLAN2|nr:glycoside hydrolase family 32 protein [Flavilitoribacter nigricans]PHN08005.1 glycosyl hydrolase family 32 [Flavilitoribacter nigricans DSM 23189 = NBRC 102662]
MKYLPIFILLLLGLSACKNEPAEVPADAEEAVAVTYREAHRPQIHFTPPSMWMNDPNGMVFYEGEYHLFYQYYPDSTVWGPMHWGHAVSPDMVRWEHLPIALYPDSLGYIFSGSAVIDWKNTSGLGTANNPPMVAIFTHHDPEGYPAGRQDFQVQSIAYSLDRGRTWTKYADNPVVSNPGIQDFRDPKVSWHEASQQWVMILAVKDRIHFYTSPNLKDWTFASEFGENVGSHGGVWECPDLFELPVEGDPEQTKWVFLLSINPGGPNGGSATQYFVGDFDGKTFTLDPEFAQDVQPDPADPEREQAVWLDYGPDNYAGVTFSDVLDQDGRRLFMGWMGNWDYAQVVPTHPWRSAMTLPRSLSLHQTDQGLRVFSRPVKEISGIYSGGFEVLQGPTEGRQEITAAIPQQSIPLELEIEAMASPTESVGPFGMLIYNDTGDTLRVGFDPTEQRYFVDRSQAGTNDFSDKFTPVSYAPRTVFDPIIKMNLFFDEASVELFADNGATVMTAIFFPNAPFRKVALFSEGGELEWKKIEGRSMRSIWR